MAAPRRALVVGGTSGIGAAIAARLATQSPSLHVTVASRTQPQTLLPHPNMSFSRLDASSMRAIKTFTDEYKASLSKAHLDILVMTQGILTMAGRTETPEGIDNKMALHYYGKQLLVRELLPIMADDARVVVVLDAIRGNSKKLDWADLDLKKGFSIAKAADHCLAMNDAMVQYWAAQQQSSSQEGLKRRHFIHAHPGVVKTDIGKNLPWYVRPAAKALSSVLAVSPETCAEHLVSGWEEASLKGEKEGRWYGYIDDKGREVAGKEVWSGEMMGKVAGHTWGLVDGALATKGS